MIGKYDPEMRLHLGIYTFVNFGDVGKEDFFLHFVNSDLI